MNPTGRHTVMVVLLLIALSGAESGCVERSKYDRVLRDAEQQRQQSLRQVQGVVSANQELQRRLGETERRIAELQMNLRQAERQNTELLAELNAVRDEQALQQQARQTVDQETERRLAELEQRESRLADVKQLLNQVQGLLKDQ
jgi:chromosome segregation ATPase